MVAVTVVFSANPSSTATAGEVRCTACYRDQQIDAGERYKQWTLYRCPHCAVEHFWPAKNPGAEWYQENDMYQARDFAVVDWLAWYHRAGLALLPANGGSLVDVGCGNGTFVAIARQQGFDALGIDFSKRAIEAGRARFGLDQLYPFSIEELRTRFEGRSFDVVTAFEVLEHVDDVGVFLTGLHSLVRPGGYLLVSVPNRERRPRLLNEGDLPPHHFTRWNREAMTRVLERYGFAARDIVVCPANITLKNWLLVNVHFNIVLRMLKKTDASGMSAASPGAESALARARKLIVLKDRMAGSVATILSPLVAPFVRGPMMVTLAQATENPPSD